MLWDAVGCRSNPVSFGPSNRERKRASGGLDVPVGEKFVACHATACVICEGRFCGGEFLPLTLIGGG